MGSGYPKEYNPRVHGPYVPSRYYGKPDVKFSDVKMKDLVAWISRREKNPVAVVQLLSRAYWRYRLNYIDVKKGSLIPLFQVGAALMVYKAFEHYQHDYDKQKYH